MIIIGQTHLPYSCRLSDPLGRDRIVTSAYSYGRVAGRRFDTPIGAGRIAAAVDVSADRADRCVARLVEERLPLVDAEGDGIVTFGEAFTFQPFGNSLITYEMTGAQIISVLEEQCQPAGSSPFLHLGVSERFTYDLATTIDAGTCTSVTIGNVVPDGAPLDPAASYDVTVNSFLADGGDNFTTLGEVTTPRIDSGVDLQALTNYLGTFGPVAPPPTDRVNELP